MRKVTVVVLALFAAPAAARAEVALGLRAGWDWSGGDIAKGAPMSDETRSQIPLQLDVTYDLTSRVSVGAYGSYGFARLDSGLCPSGVTCSGSVIRLGVEAFYAFHGLSTDLLPWVGAGIGWERSTAKQHAGGEVFEATYTGLEWLNLQVGADWEVTRAFRAGPYLMLSVGRYSHFDVRDPAASVSGGISDEAFHEWIGVGLRARYAL